MKDPAKQKASQLKYERRHKIEKSAYNREYYAANREALALKKKQWQSSHPRESARICRNSQQKLKAKVITLYGSTCACCARRR